jgi:hypothetical protein
MFRKLCVAVVLLAGLSPATVLACACGCGVFDVGTASMLPNDTGGSAWLEYDFSPQSENWSGNHRASKDDNADKRIDTQFLTAGAQYMFDRSWGINAQIPYWDRHFKTTDDDTGNIVRVNSSDLGDIRLRGIYSGFSEDMSTGVTFGLKLPTGPFNAPGFDRDTEIGTGSTDLLLGAYHVGTYVDKSAFSWFTNVQWQRAMAWQNGYRPGNETNLAVGSVYDAGKVGQGEISPMVQLIVSNRLRDGGPNALTTDSGYTRLIIAPGLEYDIDAIRLYGDIETPLYQNTNGNQLVAPIMAKFIVAYNF